jgi:hypothetical protein
MTTEVKPSHRYDKYSTSSPGTGRAATGDATIKTITQGEAENPQVEAPAPVTQMLPLSMEGRRQPTAMATVRDTNGRSYYGPSGPAVKTHVYLGPPKAHHLSDEPSSEGKSDSELVGKPGDYRVCSAFHQRGELDK